MKVKKLSLLILDLKFFNLEVSAKLEIIQDKKTVDLMGII